MAVSAGIVLFFGIVVGMVTYLDSSTSSESPQPSTDDPLQQSLDMYGFAMTNQSYQSLHLLVSFGCLLRTISDLHRFDGFLAKQTPPPRLPQSNADVKNEEEEFQTLPPLMEFGHEVSGGIVRVPSLREVVYQTWSSAEWRCWRVGYAAFATLAVWLSLVVGPMVVWKAIMRINSNQVVRSLLG